MVRTIGSSPFITIVLPKEYKVKLNIVRSGDLWTLGKHKMLFGDATKPEDLDALMGDVRANLIVTEPPYNVAYPKTNPPQASSLPDMNLVFFTNSASVWNRI